MARRCRLRDWLADRRCRLAEEGKVLAADARLFRVPTCLIRILNRDLSAAGIPKVDERGHQIDVHAMRTTFNTQLAVAGVDPRTAMAAMRVSSLNLVLKTYADEKLIDVTQAVNALSAPPAPTPMLAAEGSTPPSGAVVPIVVPTSGNGGALEGSVGHRSPSGKKSARAKKPTIARVFHVIPAQEEKRAKGLEPSTSSLGSSGTVVLSPAPIRVRADDVRRCTSRCTKTGDRLDVLARAVALVASLPLTDDERVAVVSRLVAQGVPPESADAIGSETPRADAHVSAGFQKNAIGGG